MKKVLYLVSREIYPITGGREVVLYNYCRELHEKYGCTIDLLCFGESKESVNTQKNINFINEVYYIERPSTIKKVINLIKTPFSKMPMQVSMYYDNSKVNLLKNLINKNKYDIVICDMARTAEYIRNIEGVKKILDMNDLISNRYYRQYKSINNNSNILGQFSNKLPKGIVKVINNRFIARAILKTESNLLRKYELKIAESFNDIIFVSYTETKQFNNLTNSNKGITVPIGVDYNHYSEKVVEKNIRPTIIFLGNILISHNRDAVNNFLNNIFPQILKEIPDVLFKIVGKCDQSYIELMKKNGNIEVTGMVDDLREHIQSGWISVAPLTYGSGVKTKVLETMAMGLPVITNSIGAEGIEATYKDGLFIIDDYDENAKKIVELLKNEKMLTEYGENAKKIIKEKYTWSSVITNFDRILK